MASTTSTDLVSDQLRLVIILLLLCLLLLVTTNKLLWNNNNNNRVLQLPPSPPSGPKYFPHLPFVGHLFQLGNKPHRSLAEIANRYGPLISLQLGCITTVVISSPSLARDLFYKYDAASANRRVPHALTVFDHHHASVAFLPLGPRWRTLRRITASRIFASIRLDASQKLRMKKTEQLLSHVKKCCESNTAVDIGQAAFTVMFNVLSNTLFSVDLASFNTTTTTTTNSSDSHAYHSIIPAAGKLDDNKNNNLTLKELVWTLLEEGGKPNISDFFPILRPFDPQGIHRRISALAEKMLNIFNEIIDQRRRSSTRQAAEHEHHNQYKIDNDDDDDVLDILLKINSDPKQNHIINNTSIDHHQPAAAAGSPLAVDIPHLCSDLFIAGTDTTSSSIEWAMAELVRNPDIMHKAQAELDQVVGRGNPVKETDIPRLPYLQAIIKETLRLHPSVALVLRKVNADIELGGFLIPNGAQVLVNVWAIGRDETLWENATCFNPDRFIHYSPHIDYMGKDFNFIPFGFGSRICLGLQLAHRIMPILLGSLISCFDWKLYYDSDAGQMDMDDKFGLTVQKAKPLCVVPVSRPASTQLARHSHIV